MSTVPITYIPNFVPDPDVYLERFWSELSWVQHDGVPRKEYYCPSKQIPYTYGSGRGIRTYQPQPQHELIDSIQKSIEVHIETSFDVCFLNGYANQRDHLGWHSDNSPEMDDTRPIAIVSFGVEREILFCPIEDTKNVTKLRLGNGSLCLMHAGMQDTHMHRIPKAGYLCGRRVSMTYRGFTSGI